MHSSLDEHLYEINYRWKSDGDKSRKYGGNGSKSYFNSAISAMETTLT
jgi:hypothetical protein